MHSFFAHIAFGIDTRAPALTQSTANLLIEVNDTALASGGEKRHLNVTDLAESQKVELARKIAKTATLDYLRVQSDFHQYPVQHFVDFELMPNATYMSTRLPPSKVLPDDSKVWRLAEAESDKLRTEPRRTEKT